MKIETPSSGKKDFQSILYSNANEDMHYKNIKEYLFQIEKVYCRASKLQLTIINSPTIPKGITIIINPYGMENSMREDRNGHTFFGFYKNNILPDKNVRL